jgi:DNA replication protein DnaC
MNVIELQRALRQLRCSGMALGLEARLLEAQAEKLVPLDFLSRLVQDELVRRQDRLLERRVKQAGFRDVGKRVDTSDFEFNKKMPRALVFELATASWITQHADALFLGPPGSGKSHLAQAIGFAVSSNKAIASSTARRMRSSTTLPRRSSPAPARSTSPTSPRSRCSSSTIWACASCRRPRPRTSWNS